MQVLVRDNNVDQALKALKKKMQREGIFREMKLRGHYEKPSEKRAREKAEAVRRARKLARKKMQREGLLPVKAEAGLRRALTGRFSVTRTKCSPRRAAAFLALMRVAGAFDFADVETSPGEVLGRHGCADLDGERSR